MSVVPAVSANLDENYEDKVRGPETSQRSNKMFAIGRELCFLLLIIFTTYASFNSSGSIGHGPPPTPFFSRGSLVGDFYKGELAGALLRASEAEVSFIMYYAPWDAESQVARRQFEALAHQYYKQIYFAGINCWQPRSICKRTLSKIQHFPKLVAYVVHDIGVEYRGPLNTLYMSAFLEGVMRPLHRLRGPDDLTRLRNTYNAVVVAYTNFNGVLGGPPYHAIYETALRFLERDFRLEIAFGVVTSFKTTVEMGVNRTPCIKLYLWNETLDYPGHFTTNNLNDWVSNSIHQVSLWLSPPGVKSLTLAPYINQGPALLMFTPLNNFVMYDLLREVGLHYYNCHNDTNVIELAHNISNYVSERISHQRRAMVSCQSRNHDFATTVQIVNNVWTNTSCGKQSMFPADKRGRCMSQCDNKPALPRSMSTSMLSPEQDPLAAPALTEWAWRECCRRLVSPPSRLVSTPLPTAVMGLSCRYNRSISLLALDSSLFAHFAKGLGVDSVDQTKVVLLNSEMETTHVLDEPITRASLSQFLVNFTEGKLERFQRNQPDITTTEPSPAAVTISITELTSNTFLPAVFNESMNVVVLFHTPYCGFCHAMGHVYLSVARLLRGVPSLSFTRLDGESNDVPWQYTAPHYPSILFFPARRKSESRVFAARVGITVDSLTQFVLANLPLQLRLLAMLQLCQRDHDIQISARQRECLVDLRREVLNAISSHLSRYRALSLSLQSSKQKQAALHEVLTRLQLLKQLQFSLSVNSARTPQLTKHLLTKFTEISVGSTADTLTRTRDEL